MISWKEDPLLNSENYQYIIGSKYINIYKALVWPSDFHTKFWIARTPVCLGKKLFDELEKYIKKLSLSKKEFIQMLAEKSIIYVGQKGNVASKRRTFLNYLNKGRINLVVLRIASLLLAEKTRHSDIDIFLNFLKKVKYFADYHLQNKFKVSLKLTSALNNTAIYLVGAMCGDSFISKDIVGKGGSDQTFIDGHKNPKFLKYSKQYLEYLSFLIKKIYKTNSFIKKLKHANAYQLAIHCKWFSRYHHKIFDFPLGEKGNKLRVPTILNFLPKKEKIERLRYFWRGVFDTDGTYHPKKLYISLSSKSKEFINSLKDFLDMFKIKTSDVLLEKSKNYQINIHVESILDFIKILGVRHPRRKLISESYIFKGPKRKIFKGINKNALWNGFFDLERLGSETRIANIHQFLKKIRKELKISQVKLAQLIGCRQQNIQSYEKGRRSISLMLLLKIARLKDYSKEDIYNLLEKYNCKLLVGNNASAGIKILLRPTKEINELVKYLKPCKNTIQVLSTLIKTKKLKEIFGLRVKSTGKGAYYINSKTLSHFLNTFYIYELPWKGRKSGKT